MPTQCGGDGLPVCSLDVKQGSLGTTSDLAEALRATPISAALRVFALVDGALLLELPLNARRRWASQKRQSLLVHASDEVATVGPLLYEMMTNFPKSAF